MSKKEEKEPENQENTTQEQSEQDQKEIRIEELTNQLKYMQADLENYRRQVEKQREEYKTKTKGDIITKYLTVIDLFDMAIKHKDNHEEFVKGVELIYAQFLSILSQEGVQQIQAHEKFNPELDEAIVAEVGEEGKILEVLQKGYTLKGKILRCARVKVGKGGKNEQ